MSERNNMCPTTPRELSLLIDQNRKLKCSFSTEGHGCDIWHPGNPEYRVIVRSNMVAYPIRITPHGKILEGLRFRIRGDGTDVLNLLECALQEARDL